MKLNIRIIPKEIIEAYNMSTIQENNGLVYIKICKSMYGLKQLRIIAKLELKIHMEKFGYHLVRFTVGLSKHKTNKTISRLLVDNCCVKYTSEANAEHFYTSLRQKYSITVDRKAEKYIGIILKWDYIQRTVTL